MDVLNLSSCYLGFRTSPHALAFLGDRMSLQKVALRSSRCCHDSLMEEIMPRYPQTQPSIPTKRGELDMISKSRGCFWLV